MKSKDMDVLLKSSSEESGSDDDEDAWKLTEDVEKKFFQTLSQIKSKDPKIYEKNVEFFKDTTIPENNPKKKEKLHPLTLRDYERKIVIEKGGDFSDEDSHCAIKPEVTYVEEQESLKTSLKAFIHSNTENDSEEEWGGLFKKRQKTENETKAEEDDYKDWLKGQKSNAPDEEMEKEMKPLRDYWTNPGLNKEDKFLRDYILNKKFLEHDDKDDNGIGIENDLEELSVQNEENIENKFSHRFEEPDKEFLKRYPRVMGNSLRMKDDHRKQKRKEVKERKLKEKQKKKSELARKKKAKKKEIEEKLEELKKLTGNDQLAFENVLEKDFDSDEHDKAMRRLFSEEFYSQDDPNFNPNNPTGYDTDVWNDELVEESAEYVDNNEEIHCEDPNFNMDCDYDPTLAKPKENTSRSRRRKDKHRRTTISEAVKREKPVFDPMVHKSFQEYVDQYYAIDCEDFIGDQPCRFKYRRTVPNSYGLTVEEILTADPKELDRWCSIKRVQQLKPDYKERVDAKVYCKKAANEELKRKILPSLFKLPEDQGNNRQRNHLNTHQVENEEKNVSQDSTENANLNNICEKVSGLGGLHDTKISKCKKKKNEKKKSDFSLSSHNTTLVKDENLLNSRKRKFDSSEISNKPNKKKKNPQGVVRTQITVKNNKKGCFNDKASVEKSSLFDLSDARLLAYGMKPKKFRNKLKYS